MTLKERTIARESVTEVQPPRLRPTRRPIRWLGWLFGLVIVAGGATLVVLAMLQGGESFEELYEAESGLVLGAIHEAGFEPTTYFIGESDGTLEEFEARREAIRSAFGETRDYSRFVPAPVEVPAPPTLSTTITYERPGFCAEPLSTFPLVCVR